MPKQSSRGSMLQLHALHYHDISLVDRDRQWFKSTEGFEVKPGDRIRTDRKVRRTHREMHW
jgi:hypothetical protein